MRSRRWWRRLGFKAMMVEGADRVLGWRSPDQVYRAASAPDLRLIPRNYRLSDDVGSASPTGAGTSGR